MRLNTSQAEQKLKNISKAIDALNRAVGKQSNAYNQVNAALSKTANTTQRVKNNTDNTAKSTRKWATALDGVNKKLDNSSRSVGLIDSKLRQLASTYLGVMGTKALINTSDTITSAENKLNNINAKSLGSSGVDANGNYSQATLNATQSAMDKMYVSAQKVRMGYSDMMSNVSKSMTLASDAFKGNIDNAIRFQEVMAEAYAVGGASAEEMSSSMYQMIQALGSGVLAGDELRSVREGAPLAYKAIEEFAQGVYNTEESLKELASQGKITSDMVVAAIMHASDEIDSSFAQTAQTFAQTWTQIKNVAIKAFEPVSKMMREALNKAVDNGMIQKIEVAFTAVAKSLQIVFELTSKTVKWIVDNWSWLQHIVVMGLALIAAYYITMTAIAVAQATIRFALWLMEYWYIALVIAGIAGIIYVLYLWQQGALTTCETMVAVCLIIVAALVVVALVTGNVVFAIIAGILLVLAVAFMFFEQICGGVWVVATFIGNLVQSLLNIIITVLALIVAGFRDLGVFIINTAIGLWNSLCAIATNIGIAFHNAWYGAQVAFWNFVRDCLNGTGLIAKAVNKIAALFGLDTVSIDTKIEGAKGKMKDYVSVSGAFKSGFDTLDFSDYGKIVEDGMSYFGTGLSDWSASDAYKEGSAWGSGVKDNIEDWGSNLLNKFSLDKLGDKLGLDLGNTTGSGSGFPSISDPANALGTTPAEDLLKDLGGKLDDVKGDTGSIADSLELTEEDLEYLRDLANMEWKKEYTTAHIAVHMNNKNTINNKGDLDNWVITLRDMLTEEIDAVANGVYA